MDRRRVRILDDTVVNQIAAGEVVERPASVVKELVENAIDADASEITVVVSNGGRSSIEVIDNGIGMAKDDALLAVERFGTSKITKASDLEGVGTLGFRGEALPSLASVSRFKLNSRVRDAEQGVELSINGGKLREVQEVEAPPGTRVQVKNLFFNVPARRKFLRTENTETGFIKAIVSDFAAAYPGIRFRLVADGRELLVFPKAADFAERTLQMKTVKGRAVKVDKHFELAEGQAQVQGLISHPIESVSESGRLRLIVNGRSVRDRLLLKAIRDGYGAFLKSGRYPSGILRVEVPPCDVDVNVHPQKSEVRFRNPQETFQIISEAVREALHGVQPEQLQGSVSVAAPTQMLSSKPAEPERKVQDELQLWEPRPQKGKPETLQQPVYESETSEALVQEETPATAPVVTPTLSTMRYVGQVFELYILLEGRELFAMLDMHAAHERVMFYKLKKQFLEGEIASQALLLPETLDLPSSMLDSFSVFQTAVARLGVECERFGEDSIIVRALPTLLGNTSAKALFEEFFAHPEWSDWSSLFEKRLDEVLSRLACHSSVRSGRTLHEPEVFELASFLRRS